MFDPNWRANAPDIRKVPEFLSWDATGAPVLHGCIKKPRVCGPGLEKNRCRGGDQKR
jgi:hypothetical protein